jgi:hypothetical protein
VFFDNPTIDLTGQFYGIGKQQFPLVLDLGDITKQTAELLESEKVLHQRPMHDTRRRRLHESLKYRLECHPDRPPPKRSRP